MDRRSFLQAALTASVAADAMALAGSADARTFAAAAVPGSQAQPTYPPIDARSVWLLGDSGPVTSSAYAARLATLTTGQADARDGYLAGGAVDGLEKAFATYLGKDDCAFFPTGTLANNVALRVLCGDNHHALCHYESHLYLDESDAAQRLSGLNLAPLGQARPWFTAEEAAAAIEAAEHGPYPLKIGAITIESPVRRQKGQVMPLDSVRAVASLARAHGAGLHLDAARLMLAPPTLDIKTYAAPFDTVYVSLYKYLGAPFGAVLAGSKSYIDQAREYRHLYGGLIDQGWPAALVAMDSLKTFPEQIARAHATAAQLFAALQSSGKVKLLPAEHASNIYALKMDKGLSDAAFQRCAAAGVRWRNVWPPEEGAIPFFVNDTITRRPVEEYVKLILG